MQHANDIQKNWRALRENGDPAALKFLFDHFYSPLFAYAVKLLQREALAKDALQNTFADLWQYRRRLSSDVVVRAYLFRAVRNHCCRLLRKQDSFVEIDRLGQQLAFEPEELQLKDAHLRQKQMVARALNNLSPRQREIIFLKYYENLSYQEIAEVIDINYQSVINHAHKAILKLRERNDLNFF
ncbi:MAG: sigma-70 family RNA polymerase sigma factor [Phaeodactylibacter sp.]|nr:sigma-70 family RNA polymerase sigma factor [Phaeodactylibacter sp.]